MCAFSEVKDDVNKDDVVELVNCCLAFVEDMDECIQKIKGNAVDSRYFVGLGNLGLRCKRNMLNLCMHVHLFAIAIETSGDFCN